MLVFATGNIEFATVAFATVGATVAFLKYNYTPAQLFMGDTGSLILGLVSAILVIKFIDLNFKLALNNPFRFQGGPGGGYRHSDHTALRHHSRFRDAPAEGQSPFRADRRHIHHLLIDYGFSHMQATAVLLGTNMLYICLVMGLHDKLSLHWLLLLELALATVLTYYLHQQVVHIRRDKNQLQ